MLNFSKEFLQRYMDSELGKRFSEEEIKKIEEASFVHKRLFSPQVKKYFDLSEDDILGRLRQQVYPFGWSRSQISLNPMGQQEDSRRVQLYIPVMSLMSYCILVCILNVQHGSFSANLLTTNLSICLAFNLIDSLVLKLALSYLGASGDLLKFNAIAGYRFVGFCLVALFAHLDSWPLLLLALGYLMFVAFFNYNRLLQGELSGSGVAHGLVNGTVCKGLCGGHVGVSLLVLWLTGGLGA